MNPVDYGIILLYFAIVIGLGFWYQKRASKNLDAFFLGYMGKWVAPLERDGRCRVDEDPLRQRFGRSLPVAMKGPIGILMLLLGQ